MPLFNRIISLITRIIQTNEIVKETERIARETERIARETERIVKELQIVADSCYSEEIIALHKASFSEFKNINKGRDVVIMGSGPSLNSYTVIDGAVHIGVNNVFMFDKVHLDYYFTQDNSLKKDYYKRLKDYNCVKFFGQYRDYRIRDNIQFSENIIEENGGRRYYLANPTRTIDLNIECHPLMGHGSVIFAAIHFALYTQPRRIYLVGCDCSNNGYYMDDKQVSIDWSQIIEGYKKLNVNSAHLE